MRRPAANDTVESLRDSLRALGLGTHGKKDTLLKRARKAYSTLVEEEQPAAPSASARRTPSPDADGAASTSLPARGYPGKYKAFLLFDAEGTCESGAKDYDYPNEIIEFPVVLLKWRVRPRPTNPHHQELYIASSFQSYVRPTLQPTLSAFCTSLTGISQATVDRAPEFRELLAEFERWLAENDLDAGAKGEDKDWLWVTDGPWDLRDFVTKQLYISHLKPAAYPYLSGPVLDLKTALNDRWRPELIRTTLEDPVEFPLSRAPPPKADPGALAAGSASSDDSCSDASGSSGWESPPSPPREAAVAAAPAPSPARAASSSSLPSPSIKPGVLRSSPRSSSPRLRRSPSPAAPPSPPPKPLAIPPVADQSPLMRALGAERPPPRSMGRINKHLKGVLRTDGASLGRYLTIEGMIRRLNMGSFEGPAHSGIVDAYNMARVVIHLSQLPPGLRAQLLEPNMSVQQGSKTFAWMAGDGEINLGAVRRGSMTGAKTDAASRGRTAEGAAATTASSTPPTPASPDSLPTSPPPAFNPPEGDGPPASAPPAPKETASTGGKSEDGSPAPSLLRPLRGWLPSKGDKCDT